MSRAAHTKFMAEVIGQSLGGRYTVERIIGEGGMGVVAGGRHPELDQPVAIKFMWPDFAVDELLAKRFLQEGKVAAKVHSPHLVRVFDVGRLESGVPYLVMEMLTGHDLDAELAKRGPLPFAEALDWFLQALVGLAEIHAAGIVHRDLKPANLFLCDTPSGPVVKLLDFGISKDMKAAGEGLTATETMLGTPLYMSPEQVKSSKHVDIRSDIWTLGVILYELFTGKLPFRASPGSEGYGEAFGLILFKDPTPPSELRSDIPPELEAAILRCLRKDPRERFQSVASLAHALRPLVPSSAHRIESVRRTVPELDEVSSDAPSGLELAQPKPVTASTVVVGPTPPARAREAAPPITLAPIRERPQTAAPTTSRVPAEARRAPVKVWLLVGAVALATVGALAVGRSVLNDRDAATAQPSTPASTPSAAITEPSTATTVSAPAIPAATITPLASVSAASRPAPSANAQPKPSKKPVTPRAPTEAPLILDRK